MRMRRAFLVVAVALAALSSACESGPPPVGALVQLTTRDLSDVVGKPLTILVRVDDRTGRLLAKYPVSFNPAHGSGSVTPGQITTDASGVVSVRWTLGTKAGPQSLTASAGGQSLTITATARPDAPAALVVRSGADQTGTVGEALANPPVVGVRDQYENGVPGVPVEIRVVAGGGSLIATGSRSDAAGDVRVTWSFGSVPGEQAVVVEAAGIEPLRVRATAVAGPPARVALVSGGGQAGAVAKPLATPLVFEARDRFGNLSVAGRVDFRGDGSASPSPGTAGADGRVTTVWTMGTRAGPQTMQAIAGTADSTAAAGTAAPGPPAAVARVRGDNQRGWAGGVLADSLSVLVKDEFDNPVPGAQVGFVVTGGGGAASPGTAVSRASGEARTAWRLGSSVGPHALEARLGGATAVPFAATATSGPPARITAVGGDRQSAIVGSELLAPVSVRVHDAFNNVAQGA